MNSLHDGSQNEAPSTSTSKVLLVKPRSKQSWDHILRTGLAGGMAGCIAKTVVAPLDRVKILFQASNPDFAKYSGTWTGVFRAVGSISRSDGVRGLLQGHSATLLRVFPYAAIKFIAYDQAHMYLMPTKAQETPFRRFAAGAFSGIISVLFTYPLELIRVRLAYETRTSKQRPTLRDTISIVYREGNPPQVNAANPLSQSRIFTQLPIFKFYRGFSVTLLGMVPYAGTSFLIWGTLRSKLLSRQHLYDDQTKPPPTPILDLSVGAISGVVAQTVSYPFEVVRRRLQIGGLIRPGGFVGWGETVKAIWKARGWRGFYVGLSIGYLKVVPMTAVSYACWEGGKRLLGV